MNWVCRTHGCKTGSIPTVSDRSCHGDEPASQERATGIEPACLAWEASALPLSYARVGSDAGVLAYLRRRSIDDAIQTVAGVTQAGDYVAMIVQVVVHCRDNQCAVDAGFVDLLAHFFDALRGG